MKIELLVTMKSGDGTLWDKGMIFTSPIPQDLMVEARDRPWNVRILEKDAPKEEPTKKLTKRNL